MKSLFLLVAAFFPFTVMADHHPEKEAPKKSEEKAASPYRHVVMFKFKDSATKEQIAKIEKEFAALEEKIETITDLEWGTNVSPENHDQGFTHCFIVSFENAAGLEVYLPHKGHKAFVDLLLPSLEKVLVIDFVAK